MISVKKVCFFIYKHTRKVWVKAVSAFQDPEIKVRELLGGTKENNMLPDGRVIDLPPRQIDDIYYTKQT